jgi:hypothetical protein
MSSNEAVDEATLVGGVEALVAKTYRSIAAAGA